MYNNIAVDLVLALSFLCSFLYNTTKCNKISDECLLTS